jgi:hypothetical protein
MKKMIELFEKVDKLALGTVLARHFSEFNLDTNQAERFLKYYHSLDENGSTKVSYFQHEDEGRMFATRMALQGMPKRLRHAIAGRTHIDLDMVNAHPTILVHYLREHHIPCPLLIQYIENREEVLEAMLDIVCRRELPEEEIPTRADAKTLILSIINGGDQRDLVDPRLVKQWRARGWIDEFQKEMRGIHERIQKLEPELWELACEKTAISGKNALGSLCNRVMCRAENEALMACYEYLTGVGVRVGALVFDGLMVERDSVANLNEMIAGCEQAIVEKTGIAIRLEEKPMEIFEYEPVEIVLPGSYPGSYPVSNRVSNRVSKPRFNSDEYSSAGILLVRDSGEVLLCAESRKREGVVISFLGGKREAHEASPRDTAIREFMEETSNLIPLETVEKCMETAIPLYCKHGRFVLHIARVEETLPIAFTGPTGPIWVSLAHISDRKGVLVNGVSIPFGAFFRVVCTSLNLVQEVRAIEKSPTPQFILHEWIGGRAVYKENRTSDWVEDLQFPTKHLVLHAGLGKGKTSACIRHIRTNGVKRVLVLSPRRTYAKNICAEYNRALNDSFVCYLDRKGLLQGDRLVVSMESIHRLENTKFDLVIIDECEANLTSHVCKETNGSNIDDNIRLFKEILSRAENVLWADAFISSITVNFLNNSFDSETTVIRYTKPLLNRVAWEIGTDRRHPLQFYRKLVERLSAGKKVFVFCSSKKTVDTLQNSLSTKFPDKKLIAYTSEKRHDSEDVRKLWVEADCVLTTSTITVGVNFDLPHFDCAFVHFNANSRNLVADAIQSHYRVRHLRDNEIFFQVVTKGAHTITRDSVKKAVNTREKVFLRYGFEKCTDPIFNLEVDVQHARIQSIWDSKRLFNELLKECNYTVCPFVPDKSLKLLGKPTDAPQVPFESLRLVSRKEFENLCDKKKSPIESLTEQEHREIDLFQYATCQVERTSEGFEAFRKERSRFYRIRSEKWCLENGNLERYMEEELARAKSEFGALQTSSPVWLEIVFNLVKRLGVQNSLDCETIIDEAHLNDAISWLSVKKNHELVEVALKDREIVDFSKSVSKCRDPRVKQLNRILEAYGFTGIGPCDRGQRRKKQVNGVRVYVPTYQLHMKKDESVGWENFPHCPFRPSAPLLKTGKNPMFDESKQ